MMRFSIMKMTVKSKIVYRMRLVMWALTTIVWVAVYPLVWLAVYDGQEILRGFSTTDILTYFIVIMLMDFVVTSYADDNLSVDVRDGDVSNWLLKPISTPQFYFYYNFSVSLPMTVIAFIVALAIAVFSPVPLSYPQQWLTLPVIVLFMAVGVGISFNIKFMLGCLAFWFEEIRMVQYLYWFATSLLAGWVAPLVFFPDWFARLSEVLPFQYTLYVPVMIALEKYTPALLLNWGTIAACWLVVSWIARRVMWKRAIRRYNAVGR